MKEAKTIEKGWGREVIFADTEDYCGKLMIFDNVGDKGSMHFHLKKDESWFIAKGSFIVRWIDTTSARIHEHKLVVGDIWRNRPGEPHQLEALEKDSVVYEVSTHDDPNDSLRVLPGTGQK